MSHIHSEDTTIEVKLRKALWRQGYRYRKNYKALPGTPDIVLTKQMITIFCDSDFFHGKDWVTVLKPRLKKGRNPEFWINKIERNMERDREVNLQLLFRGWTVIHFWGSEIDKRLDECIEVVEECIFNNLIDAGDCSDTPKFDYEY